MRKHFRRKFEKNKNKFQLRWYAQTPTEKRIQEANRQTDRHQKQFQLKSAGVLQH